MKNSQELVNNSHINQVQNTPQDTHIQDVAVEIKFLAKSWLDDFEKETFEGKTIDELLNNRSYE